MPDIPIRHDWTIEEVRDLYQTPLMDLIFRAATAHRAHHDPQEVQLCTLLSVKTGNCPEDCSYCPQSAHYKTDVEPESLMSLEGVMAAASAAKKAGSTRFCMGAAWREVKDGPDFDTIVEMVRGVRSLGLEACCTLGMLTPEQAKRLKSAGLTAYNHNLDTSDEFYDKIISTRKYQDRLDTLRNVAEAGISTCCGGIIGMGESQSDRIAMLHRLATLDPHPESVPINTLVQVSGTPLEGQKSVPVFEFIRMIAVARVLIPGAMVRLSAGRLSLSPEAQALAFMAGANSIFTGEKLLTTPNPDKEFDHQLLGKLGLTPRPPEKASMLLQRLSRQLGELKSRDRFRRLNPAAGVDFTSNDYLGLSRHPALADALTDALGRGGLVGSGGSRLLRGHHEEHDLLEQEAARAFGSEAALYFGSGFDANLALLSTLPSRHDGIVYDERVHASVKEGLRASFAAKLSSRHNDPESVERSIKKLRKNGAKDIFIAVESIYSMDGDRAPLGDLSDIAQRRQAVLIVDEAHATGVFGENGRGLLKKRDETTITLHTAGKALGASGAIVAASKTVRDYMINAARPFLYSTAPPPALAAVVRRSLALCREESWRSDKLRQRIAFIAQRVRQSGLAWPVGLHETPIIPVVVGTDAAALNASEGLQARGIDVRAIRPPTVPEGSARLRVSLSASRTEKEIESLIRGLQEVSRDEP